MNKTLILNANHRPLAIVSSRRAFLMTFRDDIFPLLFYERTWRDSRGLHYKVPSIVCTKHYNYWVNDKARYSKKNIFIRDLHICQYCNKQLHKPQLTLDHVIPKSLFTRRHLYPFLCNSFENVVTCCRQCNYKKSDKTLTESRMTLIRKPVRVTIQQLIINKCKLQIYPKEWKPYLE